jgi:protein NrfC
LCIDACPFRPQRIIWNPTAGKAIKCDLCISASYWGEKGGPGGKQACVEICPQKAIKFTRAMPAQTDDAGYELNLREAGSK